MSILHPLFRAGAGESVFTVECTALKFGQGALAELGYEARRLGLRRVLLVTDRRVRRLPIFETALNSLERAGVAAVVFDEVSVEPTEAAVQQAAALARAEAVDGFVSLGGGSTMDTAKVANLLATWPAPLVEYVNAPLGHAKPVPGPLKPHIACTTTFGTAAETTGIAILDLPEVDAKTGIVARQIRPSLGVADPLVLDHLPPLVLASNAFDVLSHAIESYTARPFTARPRPESPASRPLNQGANPFSALSCLEAIRLVADNLERAFHNPDDREARTALMYAGLLAGIGFGNAGNHLPHAMSYPVAHHVRNWRAKGWDDDKALVPHGIAVAVNAPAAFRHVGPSAAERFADVLAALGGKQSAEPGAAVAERLVLLMRATGLPNGLSEVGYGEDDVQRLANEAYQQRRLIENAPAPVTPADLAAIFRAALRYW